MGGIAAIAILAAGVIWYMLGESLCENQVLYERVSPNGLLKAVVFNRECGATTGSSVQISVVPRFFGAPSGAGNVFVADYGHSTDFGPKLRVAWLSSFALRIEHHPAFRVFKAELSKYGASIAIQRIQPNG